MFDFVIPGGLVEVVAVENEVGDESFSSDARLGPFLHRNSVIEAQSVTSMVALRLKTYNKKVL